jgi:predicted GNAT family acetyltransferase
MADTPTISNNTAAGQFEAETAHGKAILKYVIRGDVVDLVHTVVPQEEEGQGIGAALARAALEDARAKGQKVMPSCPFVHSYVKRHRAYADLVASD